MVDVRKGIFKCRLLTGTYLLQSNRHTFSQLVGSATCSCCGMEDEDLCFYIVHYLQIREDILFKDQIDGNFTDRGEYSIRHSKS